MNLRIESNFTQGSDVVVLAKKTSRQNSENGGRGDGFGWLPLISFDDKIKAKNYASNNKQFTTKGGMLNCTFHENCPVKRKVVHRLDLSAKIKLSSDFIGDWIVLHIPAEHSTSIKVYSFGFPKILLKFVDDYLERRLTPLRLCNKLENTCKQVGYEEHLIAFKKLLLKPEEGAYKRIQLMIQSRAVTLKKWGLGPDEIIYRCTMEDFLYEFEVIIMS
jgi:hypothetical protein